MNLFYVCLASLLFLLCGCKDETMLIYDVPKAESGKAIQQKSLNSNRNAQPQAEWSAPSHWKLLEAKPMRIAAYEIPGTDSSANFSISSFPGDVGGRLANVNRWLSQIQLDKLSESELDTICEDVIINDYSGYVTNCRKGELSLYVIALSVDKETWFFKFTGPYSILEKEQAGLHQFVQSVSF